MFKNIQFKIMLIFFIIGIVIIGGFGIFFINSLDLLNSQIQSNEIGQVANQISRVENDTKILLLVSSSIFVVIGILITMYLSKFVIYPINKLIKGATRITE